MPDTPPRSISPVNAVATGPVISTWPSSRHSISSSPPSTTTVARRPVRPRRCAFTSAAQAPEPQASVRPAPRSHTRSRMRSGASTWAKPILARSGNSGSCSSAGPKLRRPAARRHVGHEERRVRVAHAGGGRVGHRPERQVEVQRVHRPGQRDVRPVEPRRPHVDPHPAVGQHLGGQVAGDGADHLDARGRSRAPADRRRSGWHCRRRRPPRRPGCGCA